MFFDFEVVTVIAETLLEAGIDMALLPASAQDEFLAALLAANPYLDSVLLHAIAPPASVGLHSRQC